VVVTGTVNENDEAAELVTGEGDGCGKLLPALPSTLLGEGTLETLVVIVSSLLESSPVTEP